MKPLMFDKNLGTADLGGHQYHKEDIFLPSQLSPSFPMSTGNSTAPALAPQQQPQQPTNQPALAGATGNARGSMRQPALQMPNQRIGLGEAMIRMGGAGMAGASQGGLASMGAMTDAYGNIMDYNRAREMEEYNAQVAAANEEQRRKDALAARMAKSSGKSDKDDKTAAQTDEALVNLMMARDAVMYAINNPDDSDLTGIMGVAKGLVDNFTGDEDAAKRLILSKVRIDDALLRTAQTKGAITEMEMRLFLEPSPNKWRDERVWLDWINMRIDAINRVKGRMQSGETVPFYSGNQSTPSTVSEDELNEADRIVNGG
jgi:hypothetical protein